MNKVRKDSRKTFNSKAKESTKSNPHGYPHFIFGYKKLATEI